MLELKLDAYCVFLLEECFFLYTHCFMALLFYNSILSFYYALQHSIFKICFCFVKPFALQQWSVNEDLMWLIAVSCRDASFGTCSFHLTLLDCFHAVHKVRCQRKSYREKLGWGRGTVKNPQVKSNDSVDSYGWACWSVGYRLGLFNI